MSSRHSSPASMTRFLSARVSSHSFISAGASLASSCTRLGLGVRVRVRVGVRVRVRARVRDLT